MLNIILFEAMAKIMCRQVVKIMCRLTNNGLRFCSYQIIKRNIGYEMQLFASISGNTVSFVLEEQAEATTEADWTVTAIGS